MKNKILEILGLNRNNPMSIEDIHKRLGVNDIDFKTLEELIKELCDERLVYCVNSNLGLYILSPFKEGIFRVLRSGVILVDTMDQDVYINNGNTKNAMNGDKVLVKITNYDDFSGSVVKIIERKGLLAEVQTENGKRYAYVGKDKYMIDLDDSIVDGMIIGIKIDKSKAGRYFHATLDRVIGHKNAPRLDEKKIFYEFGVPVEFSKETLEELKDIPSVVDELEIEKRKDHDLRDDVIFTIDGDDTKDIDDAISLKMLDNGNYLLGVHIADVSHYVKIGSHIDLEAYEKATSYYMPGVVNPMYSPSLSNGICSLNPLVDRLALSCVMEINSRGEVVSFDIFKSVIRSRKQMTYKCVNKILEENIIPDGYEEYADILKRMKSLSNILRKSRINKGMLEFDSSEIKILTDEVGNVTDITTRNQGMGESLIEDFMLAANECVATYIYNLGVPSLYRVHDVPNEEKLKHILTVLQSYGENIDVKFNLSDPHVLQNILKILSKSPKFNVYSSLLLRCMAKASYRTENYGHFGVGISALRNEAYTHFTSPIRRYPDTTIHRILTDILDGKFEKLNSDSYKDYLVKTAEHSSYMEIVADKCEREADKCKEASYLSKFIGECYEGRISGFTKSGMYVELPNLIEGRVAFSSMDDYYNYNEDLEVIVGERSKKIYRLGDKVNIKVVRASKEAREIDFELGRKQNKGDKDGNTKQKS